MFPSWFFPSTSISPTRRAFSFGSAASKDAALFTQRGAGSYTIQIGGGGRGVALAEVYDATPAGTFDIARSARLTNLSARTQVGTGGDVLIAGFAIGGSTARTVLIRAVGPTLTALGVSGALANPKLELYSGTTRLSVNDDWAGSAEIASAATSVGAFALPNASRDSAILVTLQPGSYTAQVNDVAGNTGIALVEVYEVP